MIAKGRYLLLVIGLLFLIPACDSDPRTQSVVNTSDSKNPTQTEQEYRNTAPSTAQEGQYQKYDNTTMPKLYNLGIKNLGPYNDANKTFGDLLFDTDLTLPIFIEFGARIDRGPSNSFDNPTFEFKAPADTLVISPITGVITQLDWQPATGQQTYRVYWVNLECAIVLKEYFSAASALKLDLRDKDKRVLFTETIHFWGNWNRDGGIEMLGLIGKKELKANVLQPTLIYGGRSEFIDEKSLMDIKANAKYIQFGGFTLRPAETRAETLELFRSKLPRHVNTISIMPLMHLQQSRVSRSRGGVTEVAYHPWQPEIPNEIAKNIEQITCEIVNFGKQ